MSTNTLMDIVGQLSFERASALPSEARAADMIYAWLLQLGLTPERQQFPVTTYTDARAQLVLTSPVCRRVNTTAVGLAGRSTGSEREAEIVYVAQGDLCDISRLKPGDIALYDYDYWRMPSVYRRLAECGANGLICINKPGRQLPNVSFLPPGFRAPGPVAACWISVEDALGMVKQPTRGLMRVDQNVIDSFSQNITCMVRGTVLADEMVIVAAHYDTVPESPGAEDNASGCALLLKLAQSLANRPARRSVMFAFLGCEELGLKGSAHLVAQLSEHAKVVAGVNVDCVGAAIGMAEARCAADEAVLSLARDAARAVGVSVSVGQGIMGSDDAHFTARRIPAVSIARYGKAAVRHTPQDGVHWLSTEALEQDYEYVHALVYRLADEAAIKEHASVPEALYEDAAHYVRHGSLPER